MPGSHCSSLDGEGGAGPRVEGCRGELGSAGASDSARLRGPVLAPTSWVWSPSWVPQHRGGSAPSRAPSTPLRPPHGGSVDACWLGYSALPPWWTPLAWRVQSWAVEGVLLKPCSHLKIALLSHCGFSMPLLSAPGSGEGVPQVHLLAGGRLTVCLMPLLVLGTMAAPLPLPPEEPRSRIV